MRKTFRTGKNIYPDLTDVVQEKIKTSLTDKYDIDINFLFDDGIEFSYPGETWDVKNNPGSASWFKPGDNQPVITLTENFNQLEFTDSFGKLFLVIPTFEEYDF